MNAAQNILDGIEDDTRAGIAPTARTKARMYSALRDHAERRGDEAARDAAARIRTVALARAGMLLRTKSTRSDLMRRSGAPRGVPATAADLRRMQSQFMETLRVRGIRYD